MRPLIQTFRRYRSSAVVLIIANLLPLVGVLFWEWSAFEIILLYWTENVIIGAINVLKMITCAPQPDAIDWDQPFTPGEMAYLENRLGMPSGSPNDMDRLDKIQSALQESASSADQIALPSGARQLGEIMTFVFIYFWFCLIHGMFVLALFGNDGAMGRPIQAVRELGGQLSGPFLLPFLALAASHLYSFIANYLARGEYRHITVGGLILQPVGRVVILHLAILLAGMIVVAVGSPLPLLVLLVIGKTALDLTLHLRQRQQNALQPASAV